MLPRICPRFAIDCLRAPDSLPLRSNTSKSLNTRTFRSALATALLRVRRADLQQPFGYRPAPAVYQRLTSGTQWVVLTEGVGDSSHQRVDFEAAILLDGSFYVTAADHVVIALNAKVVEETKERLCMAKVGL